MARRGKSLDTDELLTFGRPSLRLRASLYDKDLVKTSGLVKAQLRATETTGTPSNTPLCRNTGSLQMEGVRNES